jgi:hypothetical protein
VIGAGTFFIVNGDTLTDVDVRALAAAHEGSGALVTLALVPNREPQKYGGVLTSGGGRVTGFAPRGARADGSYHFIGVQVVEADAFSPLPDGQAMNSVGEAYDRLLEAKPGCIQGFVCDAAFQDIGTPDDYWTTSFECLAARPPEEAFGRGTRIGTGARGIGVRAAAVAALGDRRHEVHEQYRRSGREQQRDQAERSDECSHQHRPQTQLAPAHHHVEGAKAILRVQEGFPRGSQGAVRDSGHRDRTAIRGSQRRDRVPEKVDECRRHYQFGDQRLGSREALAVELAGVVVEGRLPGPVA